MKKRRSPEIILIGAFAIILGVWMSFKDARSTYCILATFSQPAYHIDMPTMLTSLINVLFSLLYACILIGGVSFLLLKKWGRILLLVSFLIDALLRLYGIFNIWHTFFIVTKPVVIPKGAHLVTFNMPQEYVIFLVEIVILFYLVHPKIKEQFINSKYNRGRVTWGHSA